MTGKQSGERGNWWGQHGIDLQKCVIERSHVISQTRSNRVCAKEQGCLGAFDGIHAYTPVFGHRRGKQVINAIDLTL